MSIRSLHVIGATAFAVLIGVGAGFGIALFALPFAVILALLVSGHFVGEERILALHSPSRPRARRAPKPRWQTVRPDAVRSLLARAPRTLRGPPPIVAAV